MRPRARSYVAVAVVLAVSLTSQTAAGADRSIEEGWVEPFPVSSTIEVLDGFLVSGDLSTAVHSGCSHHNQAEQTDGVVFVDLPTGTSSMVTGAPNSNCADGYSLGPSEPPYSTYVRAVTDDGSALVSTSWEGIEAGDDDGGQNDVVLVDRHGGERTLLSGGLDGVDVFPIDVSDDGSVAVFSSHSAIRDPIAQYHVWRGGVVTNLLIPEAAAPAFEDGGGTYRLSGDGRFLLAISNFVVARIEIDTGTAITTPYTGTCCGLAAVAISDDGRLVAWAGEGGAAPFTTNLFGPYVHIWDMSGVTTVPIAGLDEPIGTHDQLFFSADGNQLFGASRSYGENDYSGGHFVWVLDRSAGTFRLVVDERPYGAYWLRIKELSPDGTRAVISTMGPVGYEPADPRMVQGGRAATRQYLWDASLTAPPRPGSDATIANQIERLYQVFFRRPSDTPGRHFWIEKRLQGTALSEIGEAFATSTEFTATYGEPNDEGFLDLVYANVLGRSPDPEGNEYWRSQLASGVTRGQVMTAFSESTEFVAVSNTSSPMAADEAAVRRLYSAYFLRDADQAGMDYWLGVLARGGTLRQISDAFAKSSEFAQNYRGLDDIQFMRAAYLNVFGRYPEPEGFDYWKRELEAGTLRGDMMLTFADSVEMRRQTTSLRP